MMALEFQTLMRIIISLFLIFAAHSLNCDLYDYSKNTITCALACPSNTVRINNLCLTASQYIINSQVYACKGAVSADHSLCCQPNHYLVGNQCIQCHGLIYNNGLACCPNDHYLDYSQPIPNCIQILTGACPTILYSTPFKVCCPGQQLYNIAIGSCSSSFGLNCDQGLFACCPTGQMLDYSQGGYACTSTCSWKSSSGLLCENKYCNTQQANIKSSSNFLVSNLLSFTNRCCLGLDSSSNCITDPNACLSTFANRGWSVCCGSGQFYVVSNSTCANDCGIGYIVFGVLCVSQNQGVDLRGLLGQPQQMPISAACNGKILPTYLPVCCPPSFYINDTSGCSLCNGNIFIFIDSQVCCPYGYSFNKTTGKCSFCAGIIDSSLTICCDIGSYVHYDTSGNARCDPFCSTDNLYQAQFCCDGLSSCSNTFSPTTCNPSYYVANSCMGCPGFCSTPSLCTASATATSCSLQCRINQIYVQNIGCLECDPSCTQCSAAMDSSKCVGCSTGYTLVGSRCQACALSCQTCSLTTDMCTSCNKTNNMTLYNSKCYGACSLSGYFLDSSKLICIQCSSQCVQCSLLPSNCTMCPSSSFVKANSCQACSPQCLTCFSSATTCIVCSQNYFKTPAGACMSQCMDITYNIYLSNTLCIPCHPDCNGCAGHPQNCVSCSLNTTYLDQSLGINVCAACLIPCVTCSSASSCASCTPGYYLATQNCVKCDNTCLTCHGPTSTDCLSCFGTSNLSPTGTCNGCSSTCSICSGNQCNGCVVNYYLFHGICLSACPSATYLDGSTCISCDSSCATCNKTNCLACSSGFFYILLSKCYNNCPANYSSSQGYCIPIKANANTTNNNSSSNSTKNSSSSSQTTFTQVGNIVDQTVLVQGNTALINVYFSNSDILTDNITVNLINKNNGEVIHLYPSSNMDVSTNKVSFSVQLPQGDLSQYTLIQTSATDTTGATSTLVSSQPSNQFILNGLESNAFSYMKVISYIFSTIMLLYILLTKFKGHFTAEEANNIILHTFNFAQICYLFKFSTSLNEGGYFYLNGFNIAHFGFFPNFFTSIIPEYYVENPVQKSLVPDGNFIRNAGFSISFQIVVLGALLLGIIISLIVQKIKELDQPPLIRMIMRVGILLFSIAFMNQIFFGFVQLMQPAAIPPDYTSFHSTSASLSLLIVILIPVIMGAAIIHFYKTYNSDVLEHYYTLRQASYYLLIYVQSLVMALGVGKPFIGFSLIGLEIIWLLYNFLLYRYGSGLQISGYKKYFGISGAICFAYLFLSLESSISWIVIVATVSISIIVLLVYCTYQIVGIYYYNIFTAEKDEHQN